MSKTSILAVSLGLALLSGCAGMRAAAAKQSSLQNSLNNYSMTGAPEQVLNIARMALVERGFAPRDVSQGIIETDWKHSSSNEYRNGGSSSSQSWKYVVTAMVIGDSTKLVVMKNSQARSSGTTGSKNTPTNARDYELELEIIRKLDPTAAAKIEADADRAGEAAANNG